MRCARRACVASPCPRNSAVSRCRLAKPWRSTSNSPAQKPPSPGSSGTTRCRVSLADSFGPRARAEIFGDPRGDVCQLDAAQRPRGGAGRVLSRQRTLVAGVGMRTRRLAGLALRDRGERPAAHAAAGCSRGSHGLDAARRASKFSTPGTRADCVAPAVTMSSSKDCLVPRRTDTVSASMAARWPGRWVEFPSSATWQRVMAHSCSDSGRRDRRAGEADHRQTGGRPGTGTRRASRGASRRSPNTARASPRRAVTCTTACAAVGRRRKPAATPESIAEVFGAAHHGDGAGTRRGRRHVRRSPAPARCIPAHRSNESIATCTPWRRMSLPSPCGSRTPAG